MTKRTSGWDPTFGKDILAHIQMLRGAMPPFAGNESDRVALGEYLASLNPPINYANVTDKLTAGRQSFDVRCGNCHTINGNFRPLNKALAGSGAEEVKGLFPVLDSMSPNMPPFTGSPEEAQLLADYIAQAVNAPQHSAGAKGGK
jgi:mono/diheme cytochrome c family protein